MEVGEKQVIAEVVFRFEFFSCFIYIIIVVNISPSEFSGNIENLDNRGLSGRGKSLGGSDYQKCCLLIFPLIVKIESRPNPD